MVGKKALMMDYFLAFSTVVKLDVHLVAQKVEMLDYMMVHCLVHKMAFARVYS